VKDYVEGQKKNLEKNSSEDFIILSKTLRKKREDTTALKTTISQLQGDMEKVGIKTWCSRKPHQNQGRANCQSTEAAGPE
jgi:hypothetical protein